jgi:hypothetical protein
MVFAMKPTSRRENGTALIEILIAIVLTSLLIGLFLHADLAVNRSIMRWTYRSGLEQAVIGISKQISHDSYLCDSIRQTGATELEVYLENSGAVRYSFRDSTITRNDRLLLPTQVILTNFEFEPLTFAQDIPAPGLHSISETQLLLTLVLERRGVGTQTLTLPIRPYSTRHFN